MNIFNKAEFLSICEKLDSKAEEVDFTVNCLSDSYFNKVKKALATDRRGEVVFCVLRPNGKAIAVTCDNYPKGIYRIPTGGIGHNEDILEAVYREVKEELGLEVEILAFPGVIKIKFMFCGEYEMFYSYLFITKEVSGRLLEDASDDEVSEIKELDLKGLEETADSLAEIKGNWSDWGKFRYASTKAIFNFLNNNRAIIP